MGRLTHLNALQALESAIRMGSFKKAEKELGVTAAALGQRIKSLEDYLGSPLLIRSHDGVKPTEMLKEALSDLENGFALLAQVADKLKFESKNSIQITANSNWADVWLKPKLESFYSHYPNIELHINKNLDSKLADCEIHFTEINQDNDLLFYDYLVPITSPLNYERITSLTQKDLIQGFPLLHLDAYNEDQEAHNWPSWVRQYGHRKTGAERGARYKQMDQALKVTRSNAGVLLCGLVLILDEINSEKLCMPFDIKEGGWTSYAYQLSISDAQLKRPQVRKFKEWITKEAQVTRSKLEKIAPRKISRLVAHT